MTLCPPDIEVTSLSGSPYTLGNIENQENDQINFQAWKRKKIRNSWNNTGNFVTDRKLELNVFIEVINYCEAFCSLLIINYGHGTLSSQVQGFLNFYPDQGKVREF